MSVLPRTSSVQLVSRRPVCQKKKIFSSIYSSSKVIGDKFANLFTWKKWKVNGITERRCSVTSMVVVLNGHALVN